MKFIAIILAASIALLPACQNGQITPQGAAVLNIAEAAIVAAAASKGVPPSSSTAIITALNSIWGAYAQAQAGQPVAQGASTVAIGQAIASNIPAATPASQLPALLQAAAQSITPK